MFEGLTCATAENNAATAAFSRSPQSRHTTATSILLIIITATKERERERESCSARGRKSVDSWRLWGRTRENDDDDDEDDDEDGRVKGTAVVY